jgi:hypothetical protein
MEARAIDDVGPSGGRACLVPVPPPSTEAYHVAPSPDSRKPLGPPGLGEVAAKGAQRVVFELATVAKVPADVDAVGLLPALAARGRFQPAKAEVVAPTTSYLPKANPPKRSDLDEFVALDRPDNRAGRQPT